VPSLVTLGWGPRHSIWVPSWFATWFVPSQGTSQVYVTIGSLEKSTSSFSKSSALVDSTQFVDMVSEWRFFLRLDLSFCEFVTFLLLFQRAKILVMVGTHAHTKPMPTSATLFAIESGVSVSGKKDGTYPKRLKRTNMRVSSWKLSGWKTMINLRTLAKVPIPPSPKIAMMRTFFAKGMVRE